MIEVKNGREAEITEVIAILYEDIYGIPIRLDLKAIEPDGVGGIARETAEHRLQGFIDMISLKKESQR